MAPFARGCSTTSTSLALRCREREPSTPSAFTAVTGAATTLMQLLVVRLLFGVGEGAFPAASFKTIAAWFPKKERATASAVMLTANTLGAALSPLIVVGIMATWGWRAVFFVLLIPGILVSILFWLVVKDRPSEVRSVTEQELNEIEGDDAPGEVEGAQRRTLKDILTPEIWKYFFAFFIFDIAYWGFTSWLPTYLVQARGFSMVEMGAAASLPFIVGAVGRVGGGWLSDRFFKDNRRILVIGTQVCSALFLYLTFVATSTWALILCQTAAGFFLSVFLSSFWALPMSTIPKRDMGLATGFINTGGQIGGLISPLCIGALLQVADGDFGTTFIFLVACILVSLVIVLMMGKRPRAAAEVGV
ncbi:MFS transporter [Phenylobacterium zucineum]|uniref:MFS transporter n=1 Tax=Phenylobacterium zucineum TaxID=284016 RepID=UPI0022A9D736|nr:MFS transporter [Phenylobacterium zucineum]